MNPDQLLKHFDRISEVPDAISHLRRFILDLAVRGKLVEQDPNDESAEELLKRIQEERVLLVKEGKIKSQELLPEITNAEIGFDLPNHWFPTRIGTLLTVIRGASPRPKGDPTYFSIERTPYHWIKISDIRKHSIGRILHDTDEFLTKAGMEKSVLLPKGTLVITNSATIGVPIFLGFDGGCIHDGYLAFPYFPDSEISKDFFFILFQTLQSYAIKMARGMAQLNLNTSLVKNFPLGLPPLAEQHRIVAKVDELMTLCDKLEAAKAEREKNRDRLVSVSLQRLNQSSGNEDIFRDDARFIFDNLPRLTTRPAHIKQLRQTILNLAVRGKLVPQDPNDEPATELLERILVENNRVLKERKTKEYKELLVNPDANNLFCIPKNWRWVSVGEIASEFRYGTSAKCSYETSGEPVLRIPNIKNGRISIEDLKFGLLPAHEVEALRLRLGDILMVRSNGSLELVGRPALVETHAVGYCYAGYLVRVRTSTTHLYAPYLVRALSTSNVRDQIEIPIRTTVGLKNVNASELGRLSIPLPPLAEQRRIVAKVDELMTICDKLEAQLTITEANNRRLLEAVLYEALSPALAEA
jgi:type I restriction enzyme, S subunit